MKWRFLCNFPDLLCSRNGLPVQGEIRSIQIPQLVRFHFNFEKNESSTLMNNITQQKQHPCPM